MTIPNSIRTPMRAGEIESFESPSAGPTSELERESSFSIHHLLFTRFKVACVIVLRADAVP